MNKDEDNNNKETDDPFKDFENEDKLNLTMEDKQEEEKEEENPLIEKEFTEFLKQAGTPGTENFNMMNEFQKIFQDICQPQQNNQQQQGNTNNTNNPANALNFDTLFGSLSGAQNTSNAQPNFDDFADKLLDQFLEKDVLYEPLQEAYTNFDKLIKEKKYDISKEAQYIEQFECIKQILNILENQPEKKVEMIELFEKMQTLGDPPEEIIKLIGPENPIGNYLNFNNNNSSNSNSNNNNQANINECRIF